MRRLLPALGLLLICSQAARSQIRVQGLQSGRVVSGSPGMENSSSGLEDYGNMWGWRGGGHLYNPLDPAGLKPLPRTPPPLRDAPNRLPVLPDGHVRLRDGRVVPWARDRGPTVPAPKPRPQAPMGPQEPRPLPSRDAVRGLSGMMHGESPSPEADQPLSLLGHLRLPSTLPSSMEGLGTDSLHRLGREDYARRTGSVLGSETAAPVPGEEGTSLPGAAPGVQTFVVAELRLSAGADLAKALASLSRDTGFRPADSLPVLAATEAQGRAVVRGWIEQGRLRELMLHPWVAEAGLELPVGFTPASRKARWAATYASLRLPADRSPEGALREALDSMARSAGFQWRRTAGIQVPSQGEGEARPGSVVVVYGELPIDRIGQLMRLPFVLRLDPTAPVPRPSSHQPREALASVLLRCLWLCLSATLLLAFPWASALLRLLLGS